VPGGGIHHVMHDGPARRSGVARPGDEFGHPPHAARSELAEAPRDFVKEARRGGVEVLFLGDSITDYWRSRGKTIWDENYPACGPPTSVLVATAPSRSCGALSTANSTGSRPRWSSC